MSNQPENLVKCVPRSLRNLHDGILSELARRPREMDPPELPSSELQAISIPDVSRHMSMIDSVSRALNTSVNRVTELEELVYDLKKQQVETTVQLQTACDRAAEVEQHLEAERKRANEAQLVAVAADKRAKDLESLLIEANSKLVSLTAALENAFSNVRVSPTTAAA